MTEIGNRKPVHTVRLKDWTDLEEMFEEGKHWVRMHTREWPIGHDLFPQVRTDDEGKDWIDFFFVPTETGPLLF